MSAYERYQLMWMLEHNKSINDLMLKLTCYQYSDPEDKDNISRPIIESFAEWERGCGFDSEIWACEEEWEELENLCQ